MAKQLQKICQTYGIPYYEEILNLTKYDHNTLRKERYNKLHYLCNQINYSQLCTGHTKDDQIENFVIRLFRGAGIRGLSTMQHKITYRNIEILRPLLSTNKILLKQYLEKLNIKWVSDITNDQADKCLRNKIRLNILPYLYKNNNNIYQNIALTQNNITQCHNFVEGYIHQFLQHNLITKGYGLFIVQNIHNETEFIQNEIINIIFKKLNKHTRIDIKKGFYGIKSGVYIAFDNILYLLNLSREYNIHQDVEAQYILEQEKKIHFLNKNMENRFKKTLHHHLKSFDIKYNYIYQNTNNTRCISFNIKSYRKSIEN